MEELKRCQCGSKLSECYEGGEEGHEGHVIECQLCGMNTGWRDTMEDALLTWNNRPLEEALQKQVDELQGLVLRYQKSEEADARLIDQLDTKLKHWRTYG